MADVKLSQLAAVSPASVAAGAGLWTLPGFIDGLKMEYVAANQLRVTSGSAYVPSLGYAINVAAAITKTGLTLTANTWYHVYLYMNGSTPDIEVVTTAPAVPYSGTARAKTGDTTRRYLGSIRTIAANTIAAFKHSGDTVLYMANIYAAPFLVLDIGAATTPTSVSCAAVVPVTSQQVLLTAINSDSAVAVVLGTSDQGYTLAPSVFQGFVNQNSSVFCQVNLDSSQAFLYMFRSAPTSTFGARVSGYVFGR